MKYTVFVTATIDKEVFVDASDGQAAMELAEDKVCKMLRGIPDITSVEAYEFSEEE